MPFDLNPVEFLRLMEMAQRREWMKGNDITQAGRPYEDMFLIVEGTAEVWHGMVWYGLSCVARAVTVGLPPPPPSFVSLPLSMFVSFLCFVSVYVRLFSLLRLYLCFVMSLLRLCLFLSYLSLVVYLFFVFASGASMFFIFAYLLSCT